MTVEPATLGRIPVLAGLPSGDLDALAGRSETRALADGETLFEAGERAETMFGVLDGQLVLRAVVDRGSTIVMTAGAGDLLGWTALRDDARWLTTGASAGRSEVVVIPAAAVLDVIASGSAASRGLVRRLFGVAAQHLEETQAQLLARGREGLITGG